MVRQVSRRTLLTALSLPLVGSLAGCVGRDWDSFPETTLTVASGNPGGVFARYGDALSTVIDRRLAGVNATARLTNASVENLRMVTDGTCDLGFTLGDIAADALRGTGPFREALNVVALARTYDSFVHLVVRAESTIRTAADLRGHRVGVGAAGSGTRVVAMRILEQSGLGRSDVELSSEPLEASATALRKGELSAFFFVSGLPNDAVLALSETLPIRLIDVHDMLEPLVATYGPEYVAGPIPASTYRLDDAVDTVSLKNYVVAGTSMPDDVAYAVTRLMFEAQAEIDRVAPGVRQPTLGAAIFTSPLGLHPGSLRYFREKGR
ncbi:MAG TPA: TAXI family TRAP transporter solute-binding subunit [Jiangellaceae bacterium]|nr:TAXI family TRAP transporter solute-binding subunit [Jiangellaceae bacterium]